MQVNNLTISDYARASHTKAILHVHFSSSTLEDTEGLDQRGRHAVLRLVDVEVFQGAASISDLFVSSLVTYRIHGSSYRWVCAPQYLSPGTY